MCNILFLYLFRTKTKLIMNKTLQSKFWRPVLSALFLLCLGCSNSSDPSKTDPPSGPEPEETTISLNEFKTFLANRVSSCEYCRSLSVKDGCFEMNCLGQESCRIEKGDALYLTIGEDGKWLADGKSTGVVADAEAVAGTMPAVTVAASGNLVVNGDDIGVPAGKSLRCIIDARKHVYVCFSDGNVALGNEMYGTYNPVLPVGKSELRILFIGNSFTEDATEHLPGILKAAGVNHVTMTRAYHGGYTLPEYNDNFASANICARRDCAAGGTKWDGTNALDSSLEEILESDTWDIVTLQEHTGKEVAWEWPGTLRDALGGLVDKIYSAQPKHRPTIVYLMAQSYGRYNATILPKFDNDQEKMFGTVTGVVKKIMSETCIDRVIPSGTMLQNLRTTSVNVDNNMDLTRDSYHMDFGLSRYGAACTVFEAIVKPCTGKTLDGNTYRYSTSSTDPTKYSTPVTDANAPIAVRAAQEAVKKPFEITNLSNL